MRLEWLGGIDDQVKSLSIHSLADGRYEMRQFDIQTGIERDSNITVVDSQIRNYVPFSKDEGIALFRQEPAKR